MIQTHYSSNFEEIPEENFLERTPLEETTQNIFTRAMNYLNECFTSFVTACKKLYTYSLEIFSSKSSNKEFDGMMSPRVSMGSFEDFCERPSFILAIQESDKKAREMEGFGPNIDTSEYLKDLRPLSTEQANYLQEVDI